eukprot:m.23374 g.23374  ORF g.23374 m.23374 type:complete len:385 (+) comp5539_c0_seq3:37-1191(+)
MSREERRFVLEDDIIEGGVLLEEEPVVSAQFCWNKLCKYDACDYCLRSLERADDMASRLAGMKVECPHPELVPQSIKRVACDHEGCAAMYCSDTCKHAAYKKYHNILCTQANPQLCPLVLELEEQWREFHPPPETTSITLFLRTFAQAINEHDATLTMLDLLCCHSEATLDGEVVQHKLYHEPFSTHLAILLPMIQAIFSPGIVQRNIAPIEKYLEPEGFKKLWVLFGMNSLGVGTSSFAEYACALREFEEVEPQVEEFLDDVYDKIHENVGGFMDVEGSALYLKQSACNHSCVPNAQCSFPKGNHTVHVTALSPMQQGQEAFISYLDECTLACSRNSRWEDLKNNYLFLCDCDKCQRQATNPNESDEEEDSCDEEAEEREDEK